MVLTKPVRLWPSPPSQSAVSPGQRRSGFAPFGDDTSTARETAFEKIRARVAGTRLAAAHLGL